MIILGIDPGIAIVGYGFIEYINNSYSVIDVGVIRTSSKLSLSKRLDKVYQDMKKLIGEYNPDEIAIEELFFSKNIKTAIAVSQARGVLILSCEHQDKPIFEYTPLQIKLSVTGYGKANKNQVGKMICLLLKLESVPKPDDAADALATAICHANMNNQLR